MKPKVETLHPSRNKELWVVKAVCTLHWQASIRLPRGI